MQNLNAEIFKELKFTDNKYSVSNLGKIRNNKTMKAFYPSSSGDKYRRFTFRRKKYRVHRLVAEHFLDNPKKMKHVCHKNSSREGKLDNSVQNLMWGSPATNAILRKDCVKKTSTGFTGMLHVRGKLIQLKETETKIEALQKLKVLKEILCEF